MRLSLPYPDKALWPNGRAHYMHKSSETKKARKLAWGLALSQRDNIRLWGGSIPLRITVFPKAKGPRPDADNCAAACKAYLDGIADALGVNDRHFAAPAVEFSDRREGKFIVEIGE